MVSGTITTANNTSLSSKERVSSSHKSVASSSSTQEEDSGTDFCIYPLSTKEEGKRPLSNNSRRSTPQVLVQILIWKRLWLLLQTFSSNQVLSRCTTSETEIKQQECFVQELTETHKNVTMFMSTVASTEVQNISQIECHSIQQFLKTVFTQEKSLNGGQKSIEEIKCKSVGFFVSELNVNIEKYTALNETNEKILKEFFFEILWIPMVESFEKWTDTQEKSFCTVANAMPWSWCHPSMVSKSFNSHIVEEWHYRKESTLVVLDENAKVVTTNALQMVETWGASAFPFSREMEVSISKS